MFTYLHVHSHYSILDGASPPEDLCQRARELGYDALGLTDTNSLAGVLAFRAASREAGIRPLYGAALSASLPAAWGEPLAVVLALDGEGFGELCRLVTARQLEPEFDLAASLANTSPHVAILCPGLALARRVRASRPQDVYLAIGESSGRGELAGQQAAAEGIPAVFAPAARFSRPEEVAVHRALRAVAEGTTLAGLGTASAAGPGAALAPLEEMKKFAGFLARAQAQAGELAGRCQGAPPDAAFQFPAYPCPGRWREFDYLRYICEQGLAQRLRRPNRRAWQRLRRELAVIAEKHFAGYFLAVWDIAAEAKRRGIPTVGRGSAANSLAAFALGITHVDPMAHGLFFERFLNPERRDPPDIDLDFPWDQRDEMLAYAYARFAPERVAMLCTLVRLRGRSAVREAGRVLGLSESELTWFTRRLPRWGSVADIRRAPQTLPEARGLPLADEPWRSVLRLAAKMENAPRHFSVHPGGIVITPGPVDNVMPRQESAKGVVVGQYDMYAAEDAGLVKIDLLGQRGLAVIRDAGRDAGVDWPAVDPCADPATRALLREGRTLGCFYVESPAMRLLLRKLRCDDFGLLTAASSVIRPGVSNSGMMRMFVERHLGRQPVRFAHPGLRAILAGTYGVMVYQEDVIKVVHAIAGWSLGEADQLRRCMSKKRHWQKMDTYRERFLADAQGRGVAPRAAAEIWRQIEAFGGYAFCKAHSASYAQLSFQAAYLKAHHPAAFMAAVLSNQGGFYGPSVYLEEARRLGLRILGPDVNASVWRFGAEGADGLRVGFMSVKGLGVAHAHALAASRAADGPFRSLRGLLARVSLTREETEALIDCGACDGLGPGRTRLRWEAALSRHWRGQAREPELLAEPEPALPALAEPDADERLALEFAQLGLSPSAHPLMRFRGLLSRLAGPGVVAAVDLARHAGRRVAAYGWLVTWRGNRVQKSGELMKFMTLEDLTGTFEVTLFPRAYAEHGHKLFGPGPYWVEGQVEDDRGGVTLTAERLENLGQTGEDRGKPAWLFQSA
ncbi:MAG: DNA polymerase III subunit alpha [candidate division FCPU426 bacterium]